MTKPDPRDERIAELEARIDKLVEAIAALASQRPTVVYPSPYVPYQPSYPSLPSWQPIIWGTSVSSPFPMDNITVIS